MYITVFDYILFPLYFLLLFAVVRIRSKKLPPDTKKYFLAAFLMHVAGSVLHSAVLQYYYHSGDAFGYFDGGEFIKRSVFNSGHSLAVFFYDGASISQLPGFENIDIYLQTSVFTSSSLAAMKFTAFFSLFSFSHFLINALFAGFLSFIGIWKLFSVFNEISGKQIQRPLALVMIYTPTIWFWGSGMGKDSISIGLLGIVIHAAFCLAKKRKPFRNLIILLVSAWLLSAIKSALLAVFLISAAGYLLIFFWKKKKNIFLRFTALVFFAVGFVVFIDNAFTALENTLEEAKQMIESNINTYTGGEDEGAFAPPDLNITPAGIISSLPATIFSTLYRPYLWEAKKLIMLFSALESFIMLAALLFVIIKGGIINFFKTAFGQPAGIFCLIFCCIMAAIIGFTTFNFGTMVRYRLPLLPFYLFLMLLVYQSAKNRKIQKQAGGVIT